MRQFSRYLTVGVLNTAFGYAVIFACMYALGLSPKVSNVVGYAVGLATSYALNRVYTFRSRNAKGPEILRFAAIFGLSFAANFVALTLLLEVPGLPAGVSQIVAGAVYVVASYLMSRRFVFAPANET